ncbi:MAG: site-2 protease family protein [Candidatus Micrarchaeales archaeon]|jgi:Zn-dependent protease
MPKKFQKKYAAVTTLIFAAAALLALVYLFLVNGSILLRFALAILVLVVSGHLIATVNGLKSSFGMYLLGGKRGIKFIDKLSKSHKKVWIMLSDWGLAFSFGALAYFMFRKQISKKMLVFGILSIILILLFVYPYLPLVLQFISIPQINSGISAVPSQGFSLLFYVLLVACVIGGFGLFAILLLIFSSIILLITPPSQQIPGVVPTIPGVTIPFFSGIISLAIILIVHEFSHGVLARIAKVKIKGVGAVLFGIIPLGAFVDPEEKEVKKLGINAQDRISVAGISANMLTSILFFIVTFLLISYVLPNINTYGVRVTAVVKNYSAYGVIALNSIITGWNNITIRNDFDLANVEANYIPGTKVDLTTNLGSFILLPNNNGKLGVNLAPAVTTLDYQITNFIYAVAVLSFGLNFFVAIFNLLPVPGLDGFRIYKNRIKSKRILNVLTALIIITILLNILPWFWTIH